jgi:outer membrane protein assembly factor BamE
MDGALHRRPAAARRAPACGAARKLAMRRALYSSLLFALALIAAGCVYEASLSQGNLIKQEDLDQVEVGMTRNQVRFLLGTPMIDDPFHEERWDYVYYLKPGGDRARFKRWVSIFFDGDTVSEIVKDQELAPDL